jgi:hypothetical protein
MAPGPHFGGVRRAQRIVSGSPIVAGAPAQMRADSRDLRATLDVQSDGPQRPPETI